VQSKFFQATIFVKLQLWIDEIDIFNAKMDSTTLNVPFDIYNSINRKMIIVRGENIDVF